MLCGRGVHVSDLCPQKVHDVGKSVQYGAPWGDAGDVITVAVDLDNGRLEFFKNKVSQGEYQRSTLQRTR